MNSSAPGPLRSWPASGKWLVALMRGDNNELYCGLVTGHRDLERSKVYFWGVRHQDNEWAAVVTDRNPSAVAGNEITISVDGTQVGKYPISKRRENMGMHVIQAVLPDDEGKRVVRLMALGENLSFLTASSTYYVQLNGIAHAIPYLSQCDAEAENLKPIRHQQ